MTAELSPHPLSIDRRTPRHLALLIIGLAGVYFLAGKLGLMLAFVHASATAVWPPTGIALAAFLVLGARVWPAIFLGAFLVNVTTAGSIATTLGIASGNTLEGLLGAALVNRFANGCRVFDRAQDVFKFVLVALVSALVSASMGTTSLSLGGYARWADYQSIWLTWWLGDVTGALIVAPVLLLWWTDPRLPPRSRTLEASLLLLSTVLVGLLVFAGALSRFGLRNEPLDFLCIPPLVWAAFRFGKREAATLIFLLVGIAVVGTLQGFGPFATGSGNESLLLLQVFMAIIAVTTLSVAALIEERAHAQAELLNFERVARAEAETATRAKDEFLAILGHELRNPLAALTGAAGLLERSDVSESQAARARDVLSRQLSHLGRMMDDLLDIARITSGKIVLQRERVDLAQSAARCVSTLRAAGKTDSHRVTVDLEATWVEGDSTRLDQVMTNLLTNSLKFTPPGGAIDVSVKREENSAVLRVRDRGGGIESEMLPRIFDPFVQGAHPPDRAQGGLGLGLTLARRLVELHGGSMEASSEGRYRGSTFTVKLPLVTSSSAALPPASDEAPPSRSRRVLVVEDHEDVRQMLQTSLELSGHDVHVAPDGPTAVDVALRCRPEVALIDVGLPGFDGYEVARRIRSAPAGHRMLLIAVTGYGEADDRRRAEQAGFDLHVVKPLHPERLETVLAAIPEPYA